MKWRLSSSSAILKAIPKAQAKAKAKATVFNNNSCIEQSIASAQSMLKCKKISLWLQIKSKSISKSNLAFGIWHLGSSISWPPRTCCCCSCLCLICLLFCISMLEKCDLQLGYTNFSFLRSTASYQQYGHRSIPRATSSYWMKINGKQRMFETFPFC